MFLYFALLGAENKGGAISLQRRLYYYYPIAEYEPLGVLEIPDKTRTRS
jgi:hypothetical protein